MKTSHKLLAVSVLLCSAAASLNAQALRTGYFSDSYLYRHQLNPALANKDGYVSFPVLGQTSIDLGLNFGVKNFIYDKKELGLGSGLTTFMNGKVDGNKFLGDLADKSQLNTNLDLQVLSVGFNAGKGYGTVELGVHARAAMTLSKDLFAFMKNMGNQTYDLGTIQANGMGWADVSLGYSYPISENLRLGAKVKYLVGVAYADADFSGTRVTLDEDKWTVNLNGEVNIAAGGKMKQKSATDKEFDGYDDITPGLNGSGLGFDLGVFYDFKDLVDGLKVSAAVTDLGNIKWDAASAGAKNKTFLFDGFHELKIHDGEGTGNGHNDGSLKEQGERIEDDLEDLARIDVLSESTTVKKALGATVNVGAEYEIPAYKKLSFGLLYSQRFSDEYEYKEGRLVMNFAPHRIFDLALSGCYGTYGLSYGALINLHVPGFNIFAGVDRLYTGSVNSDMIPLEKGSMNFSFGLNIPFGSNK